MSDTPTLVRFKTGYELIGTGADGLPLYADNIIICLSRPPYLGLERVATEEEIQEHSAAFAMFQKEMEARNFSYTEGYPLALWPACTESLFKMLAAREITTVEQLAKLYRPKIGAPKELPPEIRELAERAAKLMELQKGAGKFEELLRDRDGQIEALKEQLDEANKMVATLKTQNDALRMQRSA